MYCLKLTLQPTAAMTFRVLPGSILNIATYPFVPPTTFSGFLRRLGMMSVGLGLPNTGLNKSKPPIYALPPRFISLGAYATESSWSGVHRTYRKGMRSFNHDAFSQIYQAKEGAKKGANFQLHTWEYFFAEMLTGYVVSDTPDGLSHFQDLEAYGCKIGKEGFAFVLETSEIVELKQKAIAAMPSTIAPMDALIQENQLVGGCDIYNLYHYERDDSQDLDLVESGFLDDSPSAVSGFSPFVAAYFGNAVSEPPAMNYYTNEQDIHIPVSLVQLLRGESYE